MKNKSRILRKVYALVVWCVLLTAILSTSALVSAQMVVGPNYADWSPDGQPLAVLEGHTESVYGVLALADGRLLSWSEYNSTLRSWGRDSQTMVQLVPIVIVKQARKAGSARGLVKLADDFDAPLSDFDDYSV